MPATDPPESADLSDAQRPPSQGGGREPFEVFLSHNSKDKPAVRELASALKEAGVGVWLDECELIPGRPWQEALEEILGTAHSAAVLIGADGLGPWHNQEMRASLSQFVDRGLPVIPVLLPGAPDRPELPFFLRGLTWVDLRDGLNEAGLRRLVCGIRGEKPGAAMLETRDGGGPAAPAAQPRERPRTTNPFTWRKGITDPEAFFGREDELRRIRNWIESRQNCQIVGPRRIGKTSLLLEIQRQTIQLFPDAAVAYLDQQDPRCYTLSGWLKRISRELGWKEPVESLGGLTEALEDLLAGGPRAVICIDEFEGLLPRRGEFDRDFFSALRYCGQRGVSLLTASQAPLSELTEPGDPTSPFYNTFPKTNLVALVDRDARDFVTTHRDDVPSFDEKEKEAILAFARNHPLALQVACYHVLEGKLGGVELLQSLEDARDDLEVMVPSGWQARP